MYAHMPLWKLGVPRAWSTRAHPPHLCIHLFTASAQDRHLVISLLFPLRSGGQSETLKMFFFKRHFPMIHTHIMSDHSRVHNLGSTISRNNLKLGKSTHLDKSPVHLTNNWQDRETLQAQMQKHRKKLAVLATDNAGSTHTQNSLKVSNVLFAQCLQRRALRSRFLLSLV